MANTAPLAVGMDYGSIPTPASHASETEQKLDNRFLSTYGLDYLFCFNSCFVVPERHHVVELFFGSYHGTITEPGIYCRNSCSIKRRTVSTALISIELPNVKVADARGSPLMVSGIVTYEVVDARRACIDVNNCYRYVSDQAPAVLKRVIAQFPYESPDNDEPCLRSETAVVSRYMANALQDRCAVAGVKIESFSINELSYAPEIAQSMLKRQQAGALIEARQRIVEGATDIAKTAASNPDMRDVLTPDDRSRLVSNLLLILASDKDVSPVVTL